MSTSNDMRKFIGYMYGKKSTKIQDININEQNKEMSMRMMLGKMRKLKINEANQIDISTNIDQKNEEEKMNSYFKDNNVTFEYQKLKVFPDGVIFGGGVDGQFDFIFEVTPYEETSDIKVLTKEEFNAQDPENDIVIKKIESYYDIFYKYWRDQLFNK